jgi:hypothetical protein
MASSEDTASAVTADRVIRVHITQVAGHAVFYREAGDPSNPAILLHRKFG